MSLNKLFLNLPIARKLLLVSGVPVLAVLILSLVTYRSVQTFSLDEDRLNDVYLVQSASAEYMRLVVDLETGFRGFILTQKAPFLQPYLAARQRVLLLGNSLRQMVKSVEEQRQVIETVQGMVEQLMNDKDRLIERVKAGFPQEATDYVESETGRILMLAIREEMARFDRREVTQLQHALGSSAADRAALMGVVVWGGSLALILLLVPLHLIARSITGPLTTLVKAVENVSGGNIPNIPVFQRGDEIGELTKVMQTMGTQIRNHIRRIEQSEQELRTLNQDLTSSEAKYRGIVDYAPIGIFTAKKDHLIFSNRQNWVLAGRNPDEVLDPEHMWEAIHPDDREGVRETFQDAVHQSEPFERVLRFLHPDGAVRKVLCRAVPIQDHGGQTMVYQGFNVDITALEYMRAQLNRSDRLATLGQMAAGIAHEIRNPLVGIGSTTTLLMEDFPDGDSRHEDLVTILKETRRLDRIVNQIVDFARPRDLLPVTFQLQDLIQESLQVLNEPIKQMDIQIDFHPPAKLHSIQADRDQLKQVLLNVIQNAVEAMSEGGCLRLSVEEETIERIPGLRITVQDNGKGISPSALPRIFEPFFTTGKHRGTGLGLPICRNIIEAHGGEIHAESQSGIGTTMTWWLPCVCQPQLPTV
ncbi:ATP-binding protein [Candidatus Nitrospira neomarina]|uniref:histidine kinase n=1 Tax=Candidatus Nitrospira neomarina TaxID=3020899 RepID=A0AA96GHK7_9BACT|nr:ATP-binding protein [Candidatus Nitrospira neomarina]WNM61417.1 ATP-binding protein [Candidatus Nitrospira neomarina]